MMEVGNGGRIYGRYSMGPRVPMMARDAMADVNMGADVPSAMLVTRADDVDCVANPNLCEKPYSPNKMAVPITLGVM